MRTLGRPQFVVGCLVAASLLAGCGANGVGGGYGNSSTNNSAPAATATTAGPSGASVVRTATAPVRGQDMTVLADSRGYTLYYFDHDTSTTVKCTGQCAQAWPPLLTSDTSVQAPAGISGTLTIVQGADGTQVEYNGHPLYTYSGDTAPSQANGEGVQGVWHVALPTTPAAGGSSTPGYSY